MADLLGVRKLVVKATGRHELVVDASGGDFSNNVTDMSPGADIYINTAQKLLDDMQETPQSLRWFDTDPSAGVFKVLMSDLRAVQQVWVSNADGRAEIGRMSLADLLDAYSTPAAEITQGTAYKWANHRFGRAPEKIGTAAATYDSDLFTSGDPTAKNGIIFFPPSDGSFTLNILGNFYSETLALDADVSYWTVHHPQVLALATQMVIEGIHRNSNGMADLQKAISPFLTAIDKNLVDEEIAGVDGFGG